MPDDLRLTEAEALRARLTPGWRRYGRFALWTGPQMAMTAPLALAQAPQRARLASCAERPLGRVAAPPSRDGRRQLHAARQHLWRALRGRRGLVPAVLLRQSEDAHIWLTCWIAALDGAALSGAAEIALQEAASAFSEARFTP